MLSLILLSLIVIYEGCRIAYMKDYFNLATLIKQTKGKKEGDKEFDDFKSILSSNKKYIVYIVLEYLYLLVLVILVFTQYWLVSLVLIGLSFIVYKMKQNDNNIYLNYLDSFVTIIVIILAVAML